MTRKVKLYPLEGTRYSTYLRDATCRYRQAPRALTLALTQPLNSNPNFPNLIFFSGPYSSINFMSINPQLFILFADTRTAVKAVPAANSGKAKQHELNFLYVKSS